MKTAKKLIEENLRKFETGEWSIKKFSEYHDIPYHKVQKILNEKINERITESGWIRNTSGEPLSGFQIIRDPAYERIYPTRINKLENGSIELIYESKLNKNEE